MVDFGDIALAVEPVICIPKSHESRGEKQRISRKKDRHLFHESCHCEGVMSR